MSSFLALRFVESSLRLTLPDERSVSHKSRFLQGNHTSGPSWRQKEICSHENKSTLDLFASSVPIRSRVVACYKHSALVHMMEVAWL